MSLDTSNEIEFKNVFYSTHPTDINNVKKQLNLNYDLNCNNNQNPIFPNQQQYDSCYSNQLFLNAHLNMNQTKPSKSNSDRKLCNGNLI